MKTKQMIGVRLGTALLFVAVSSVPAFSTTLTVGSCIPLSTCTDGSTGTVAFNDGLSGNLSYKEVSGGDVVTLPAAGASTLGNFTVPVSAWATNPGTITFSLYLTEGSTTLPAFSASLNEQTGLLTFTAGANANGWVAQANESLNGTTYLTEYNSAQNLIVGVQQTDALGLAKSTALSALVVSTPEPGTLGSMAIAGLACIIAYRRRFAR